MAKKRLNRADVIICLQQVCGKRMPEGMGSDALGELCSPDSIVKGLLDVSCMQMISPQLLCIRHVGQRQLRKKTLPDKLLTGFRIFFFELIFKQHTCVA